MDAAVATPADDRTTMSIATEAKRRVRGSVSEVTTRKPAAPVT